MERGQVAVVRGRYECSFLLLHGVTLLSSAVNECWAQLPYYVRVPVKWVTICLATQSEL